MKLALLTLVSVALLACSALLGDDFVIVLNGDGGSGGSGPSNSSQGGAAGAGASASGGAAGSAVGTPCDAALQDCPQNLKCLPHEPPPGVCAANGTLDEGSACTAMHPNGDFDDCAADLLCVEGVCRVLCDQAQPACGNGQGSCVSYVGGFGVCLPWCDPLAQQCGTGQGCYPEVESGGFICAPEGTLGVGQACMFVNHCAPGLVCGNAPECSNPCCKSMCNVNTPGMCTGADVCTALGAAPPYEHVGVCLAP